MFGCAVQANVTCSPVLKYEKRHRIIGVWSASFGWTKRQVYIVSSLIFLIDLTSWVISTQVEISSWSSTSFWSPSSSSLALDVNITSLQNCIWSKTVWLSLTFKSPSWEPSTMKSTLSSSSSTTTALCNFNAVSRCSSEKNENAPRK